MITSLEWLGSSVRFLDQTQLPNREEYVQTDSLAEFEEAIRSLKIRGAPLLGIAAAYGILLGLQHTKDVSIDQFIRRFQEVSDSIAKTRPTAKNLFWALERMGSTLRLNTTKAPPQLFEILEKEALQIHAEDREQCLAIGKYGSGLIPDAASILTHCNTGVLATGGIGTAQAVIVTAHRAGKRISVFADETRPLLQGARLTVWELQKEGIPVTLITDNSAAWTVKTQGVNLIITGADRIAANGDTANKIGTYNLSILAREHGIPFYIAAPSTTIDMSIKTGREITIEERNGDEVTVISDRRIAAESTNVFAPAFDVAPAEYITAIITEKGVILPPYEKSIAEVMR